MQATNELTGFARRDVRDQAGVDHAPVRTLWLIHNRMACGRQLASEALRFTLIELASQRRDEVFHLMA